MACILQFIQKCTHFPAHRVREHCGLCTVAQLHFLPINVCLLYKGTWREKRNSYWCLFELWPNPSSGSNVGAHSTPNPSRSCTPSQTHAYCTHAKGLKHTHKANVLLSHTHLPVHADRIKVRLSFPAHRFRSSQSRYFPLFPTDARIYTETHCSCGGGGLFVG